MFEEMGKRDWGQWEDGILAVIQMHLSQTRGGYIQDMAQ